MSSSSSQVQALFLPRVFLSCHEHLRQLCQLHCYIPEIALKCGLTASIPFLCDEL
jgi:hypothetical protein